MNYIKSIKNISGQSLIFNNLTLLTDTTILLNDNLKSNENYTLINKYYFSGLLSAWDNNDNLINSNSAFDSIWSFWKPIFYQKEITPNYYRIYDYLTDDALLSKKYDYHITPKAVDYIKDVNIRFARKETFTRGFLTNVEYYESSTTGANNITTYYNKILNVNMKYYINNIGYTAYRETTRVWALKDGTYSNDSKVSVKQYNGLLSREESIQRRTNIINQLVIDIVNIVYMNNYLTKTFDEVELMVLPLMDSLEDSINKYIKGNLQPLIEDITNASEVTYTWLTLSVDETTTLHEYIENVLLGAILSEGFYTTNPPS